MNPQKVTELAQVTLSTNHLKLQSAPNHNETLQRIKKFYKRSPNWNDLECQILLDLYLKLFPPICRNPQLAWRQISKELSDSKVSPDIRSDQQCKQKLRDMRKRYRQWHSLQLSALSYQQQVCGNSGLFGTTFCKICSSNHIPLPDIHVEEVSFLKVNEDFISTIDFPATSYTFGLTDSSFQTNSTFSFDSNTVYDYISQFLLGLHQQKLNDVSQVQSDRKPKFDRELERIIKLEFDTSLQNRRFYSSLQQRFRHKYKYLK